jgi:hypothetical protein
MPLRYTQENGWTYCPPTSIPYEDPGSEPKPAYSFFWSHYLIHEANVLILSKGMDPLEAIHIVEQTYLKKKQKH